MLKFTLPKVLVRTIGKKARVFPCEQVQPSGDADNEKHGHTKEDAAEAAEVKPNTSVDQERHHSNSKCVEDHGISDRSKGLRKPGRFGGYLRCICHLIPFGRPPPQVSSPRSWSSSVASLSLTNRVLSTMPQTKNKQVEKPSEGIVDKTG